MQFIVTGANRGIGLEFVQQLADRGDDVVATARDPEAADQLQTLAEKADAEIHVESLDVTDQSSVDDFVDSLPVDSVDVLINNAGTMSSGGSPTEGFDYDEMRHCYEVNTLGPLRVTEALLPVLRRGEETKVVNITSKMGSIADNGSGGSYAYRTSKTALNMATRSMAVDLRDEGIITFVMHPGWVQTRMGGDNALISTEKSVDHMLDRIEEADPEQSGEFIEWDGGHVSW
jgi:NAD(P)-dependent dehydrogenase (short-subunit alcohol dehydrogenase family)